MTDTNAIREVSSRLKSATNFIAVFGALPAGGTDDKRRHVRKQFAYLARIVHPDHAPAALAADATDAFRLLNALRHAAEEAIERNTYDAPISRSNDASEETGVSEIVTMTGTYRLKSGIFREGDFSILYRGTFLGAGGKTTPVFAKVARDPSQNNWIEKEAVLMRKAADAKAKTPLFGISPFLPRLLDTVLVEGDKRTRYRTNIYRFAPDMVSVADIIAAYPRGLDAPQAAWVARRVFAQTLAAGMLGVVHGAITPDHVLVNPFTHEPLHIGWPHAQVKGRITHIVDRWQDIYPPEVFDKKDADHRTDIYMAAATTVRLLGGDVERRSLPASVPDGVARVILRCLETSPARRPRDGKLLLDDFTRVVRSTWGTAYRPLTMPIR